MNREYIVKEGILEAYFLGELTASEEQQVLEVLNSDPELMQQYKDLEKSMEKLALENAVTPPRNIKDDLLKQISISAEQETSKTKVITGAFYKRYFAVAASVAIIFMTTSMVLMFQLNTTKTELEANVSKQESLIDSLNTITKNSLEKDDWIAYVNDPNTERHLLLGNKLAPDAAVLSYVNHKERSVLINLHNLPEIEDKDYQMWADVDGEMINMGVIDLSQQTLAMNYIEDAESINITIEEKGGSDHPDVSQLIGSVAL